MGTKVSWFDTTKEERESWESICPPNEYRVVKPGGLPAVVPYGLVDKADSILVVASGTESGNVIYMANMHRVDENDYSIDQEPFGLAFLSDDTTTSGCLIHHGKWDDRTTKPPADFWKHVTASGIGNCYPISELPEADSGKISDLNIGSQEGAFQTVCSKLREAFDL